MNGLNLRPDFNVYPHICDHAGHACDTADANRRWLVTGIQDGGHHFRFRWSPFRISVLGDVGQGRQSHIHVGHGRKYVVRSWNRCAIHHRQKVISTSGLAVAILNFANQPTSGNVGSERNVSSKDANVGVAVGIVPPADCIQ